MSLRGVALKRHDEAISWNLKNPIYIWLVIASGKERLRNDIASLTIEGTYIFTNS